MGMGGAHIHCRTGMDIPYMSGEFLDLVSYAHEQLAQKGMLTWLGEGGYACICDQVSLS